MISFCSAPLPDHNFQTKFRASFPNQIPFIRSLVLTVLFSIINFYTDAGTFNWTGAISNNWSNPANWITSGVVSTPIPSLSDDVVFDGNGLVNCTVDVAALCNSLTVNSTYTKTITQLNSITIGTPLGSLINNGISTWSGGAFVGGTSLITNHGSFTISGCNFTSTNGNLDVGGNFSLTSGTFSHNNGTVTFDFYLMRGTNAISVSHSLSVVTFNNLSTVPYYNTITFVNPLAVNGDLTLNGNNAWLKASINASSGNVSVYGTFYITGNNSVEIDDGQISTYGDITISNTATSTFGTGSIYLYGNKNLSLTGPSASILNQGNLPNVYVSKTGGSITVSNYVTISGPNFIYSGGTINSGPGTICFYNPNPSTFVIDELATGSPTMGNVYLYGSYKTFQWGGNNHTITTDYLTVDSNTTNCNIDTPSGTTLNVNGRLTFQGSGINYFSSSGTWNIKGDIVNNNTSTTCSGITNFIINGTANQSITGTSSADQGAYPTFVINKPSGTLSLSNYLTFCNGFTWTSGTISPGNSTCVFGNQNAVTQTITAGASGMSFNNIQFEQPNSISNSNYTQLATDISVLGNFTINATGSVTTNNHNLTIGGNFTAPNAVNCYVGGTSTITLNGTSQQSITSNNSNANANKMWFYNLVINNTAGRTSYDDILLNDPLHISNSITFSSGRILTTSTNFLHMKDASTANVGTINSYVNGPMTYDMAVAGSRTLNFPIGDGGNLRYVVLGLSHSNNASRTYTAQVVHSSASALGYSLPGTVDKVSGVRYVDISRSSTNGLNGTQTITMYYGSDDGVTDYTKLTIVKTTGSGSPWIDIGGSATANTIGTIISTSSPSVFNSFSKFTLANRNGGINPLPIEISYFKATAEGRRVLLAWQTATEKNSDQFVIERSDSGKEWEELTKVTAAGNSNRPLAYQWQDSLPFPGTSYYRLSEIDRDGKNTYSSIVKINVDSFEAPVIYPNPVADNQIFIEGKIEESEIRIYDQTGIDVTSLTRMSREAKTRIVVDVSRLSSEVYIVSVRNASFRIRKIDK
jgi:hypothetical protein